MSGEQAPSAARSVLFDVLDDAREVPAGAPAFAGRAPGDTIQVSGPDISVLDSIAGSLYLGSEQIAQTDRLQRSDDVGNPAEEIGTVMHFDVLVEDTGQTYRCSDARSLLESMEMLGRSGLPVGCRNGGCGVCKVRVISGRYTARKMSRACVTVDEEAQGIGLACRIFPVSDLTVRIMGKIVCAATGKIQGGFVSYASGQARIDDSNEAR